MRRINKIGDRHFRLVLTRQVGRGAMGLPVWECLCDCGNTTTVHCTNIKRKKSCGCIAFLDLRGQRFGKLTAVERIGATWRCECECGNTVVLKTGALRSGHTRSCGCVLYTHRRSRTIEYLVWTRMKARCYDTNLKSFPNYGGRGIKVCAKWRFDFAAFLADMGPRPAPGYSIERINNDGDYEPSNCRWATAKEQQNNRRTNRLLTCNGKTQTVAQWGREFGIGYQALVQRLNRGIPMMDALTRPLRITKRTRL